MTKEVFIHIGLPKTGTTFLQHKIHINAEKLRKNGIYVPKTGLDPFQYDYNLLALALQPERWHQFHAEFSVKLPDLWADFVEEIANCCSPIVLVSAETLSWELKDKEQIRAISEKMRGFKVKIVLCGREPYDFISSMYGQILRTGRGPYTLESFLLEFPYYWSPEFHKRRWAEFFGEENVLSLSYEDLKGEFLFEKFLGALFPGHAVCSEQFDSIEGINRNNSLSPRFLRFLEELSANQVDIEPYINLYSKSADNFSPLESRTVTPLDIDEALRCCGMVLNFSNIIENVADQQRQSEEERIELQAQIKAGLPARAPIMTTVVQELVKLRSLLAERTERLELASKELIDRTQALVERTSLLEQANTLLEQTNKDLQERTQELVDIRQTLVERTALLEQANKDLQERIQELVDTRQALAKLEQTSRDLQEERTRGLADNCQTLAELEQANKDLQERAQELADIRQTLAERTALLEQANKDLQERTQEIENFIHASLLNRIFIRKKQ